MEIGVFKHSELKIAFIIAHTRNNVVVLFGTLKVQSFVLTEVRDCNLLIVVTSSTFLKRKDMLKAKSSQPRSSKPAAQHIYRQMYFVCTPIQSTCILRFSRSGFFWLSRCPSHTWAHIKYPSSLCMCTCVYKHTHTHHPNTRKNREIYETKPISLTPPKHRLPHQEQAII